MRCVYTRNVRSKVIIVLLLLLAQVSILIVSYGETPRDGSSLTDNSNGMLGKDDRPIPFQNNTWTNITTGTAPPPRTGHAMAYDSKRGKVILFGGVGYGFLNDTWIFDTVTSTWANVSPSKSPSPRSDFQLAYDSESDRVVLFGGWIGNKPSNDTWAYDPGENTWEKKNPKDHPSSCYEYGMTYDSGSDRVILFGGHCINYMSQETWSYNYNRDEWKTMGPSPAPDSRYNAAMTYDSRSDRVILFGGTPNSPAVIPNETWEYDADRNTWTNLTVTTRPPRCYHPSMAYDIRSDRIVLSGSANGYNGPPDTWLYDYDTNSWVNATTSNRPSNHDSSAAAYDQINDRMVLFGWMDSSFHYHNDTWTYELSNIPYVEKVSPSNGILDLSLSSNVNISFSEVMDRGATERAVTLTPKVPMSASWDISGKVLSLAPGSTLESGASVAIHISTNATSADGHSMRYSYAFSLVILKPVPAPTVDAQTVLIVMGIVTAVAVATVIGLSEWLLYSALILLLPLYAKIKREKVLDNFMRGRIYQFIVHCPGAHLRFIKKTLGVEMGVLSYHLNVLERSGMIRSEKRGNFKRFFCTKKEEGSGINEYQSLQKDILNELTVKPGQGIRSLSTKLSKNRQVVAFCVHDLLDKEVLINKRTIRGVMFHLRV